MRDDPITLLERQLVDAARRRTFAADERDGSSHEPRGPWPPAPRPARRRSSIGALAAVALSALTVALGAVVLLHGHKPPARATSARPAAIPGRQRLTNVLGVLRRPQVPADLRILSLVTQVPLRVGSPDRSLVRYATTTPWGERLYLVPMKPPTPARAETLVVFSSNGGGAGAGDAQSIEAGQGIGTEGGGGIRGTRVTVVVPDGVASVRFVFPRQPVPEQFGAPIYRHSLILTAPVHDNVVAVQVARQVEAPTFPMIWYAADGHVVKRIGDLAGANRVVPTPQPGPETAQSRAAERDPSTPNRVWVSPSVGGPHTNFMVHFRVLVNGGDYSYRLSGAKCPGITPAGGGGGGTDDLRGRIWAGIVDAVQGQAWCPGTYHLSVTIMDLGRHGGLKHPARPFGTATFTVKR